MTAQQRGADGAGQSVRAGLNHDAFAADGFHLTYSPDLPVPVVVVRNPDDGRLHRVVIGPSKFPPASFSKILDDELDDRERAALRRSLGLDSTHQPPTAEQVPDIVANLEATPKRYIRLPAN